MQLTQEQQLVSHDLLIGNENRRGGEGQWEGPLKVRSRVPLSTVMGACKILVH